MIKVKDAVYRTDVLIVGGGIAGLMAAIAAADQGAQVTVVEKGNTKRSGSGATGNDHFRCYISEVHGSFDGYLKEFLQSQVGSGGYYDVSLQIKFLKRTFEVVQDWQRWGIDMKPTGDWEFTGHAFPGRMRTSLKYNGVNQKEILTREAVKRGVKIVNRVSITEFLTDEDGNCIGALGISIDQKEPIIQIFQAKAVITATGTTGRLYPAITGGWMFNTAACPGNAGGGRAAAYRAGAKLVNLEIPMTQAGPKYFARGGKATWIGVLEDSNRMPVGPFVTKPNKLLGDITSDVWQSVFVDKQRNGTGPVYMDCSEIKKEDMDYMMWGFTCEGVTSIIDAMEQQDIDLHKHMIEFSRYEPILIGRGVEINDDGSTSLPGLYAAGDEVGNFQCGIAGAAVIGRVAGESAAQYALECSNKKDLSLNHPTVVKCRQFYDEVLNREEGAHWKELNLAVQQLMNDYAGVTYIRSESMLRAGLKYLSDLERYSRSTLKCKNAHELMRGLEALDLLQLGQLICITALERKESRGMHRRMDYTFTNPLLNGTIMEIQKKEDGYEIMWRHTRAGENN